MKYPLLFTVVLLIQLCIVYTISSVNGAPEHRIIDASLQPLPHHILVEHHSTATSSATSSLSYQMDEAELEAESTQDESHDPSGHSPFRVRRVDISVDTTHDSQSESIEPHTHSLLEHTLPTPAQQSVDIPLTISRAEPHTVETVLLELRSRQQSHNNDFDSFIQLSEGESQDEMEIEDEIEYQADLHHQSESDFDDISALEIRSKDVPLYQEVLKEKHLATYYGSLRIGESLFRVLFDTGSCELWVPSEQCTTKRCTRHKRYPISTSKPQYFGDTRLNIQYISGKVSGRMIVSDVGVGELTVPNQILGLAKVLDIELLDEVVWDGIVGLAYPSKSLVTRGVTPLFDNIIKQRLLSNKEKGLANQFAYYIDDTQGVMTFGGVNCAFVVKNSGSSLSDPTAEARAIDECKSSFQFVPVTRSTYWTLTLDDVSLSYPVGAIIPPGQKLKGNCGKYGCRAIVDTGTYLIYTSKFFGTPSAWSDFDHCIDTELLPNITFHFRTDGPNQRIKTQSSKIVSLTLEPREYILKFSNSKSKEDCVVGISPDKDSVFTLGQVFLRAYYTLFDRDENRVGFSKIHRQGHEAVNAKPSKPVPKHLGL
jgi:hypothetical protein